MTEKEFQSRHLTRVKKALDFAMNNSFSDFYKVKFNNFDLKPDIIKNYADFRRLPFLTKDEILSADLDKRMFVPKGNITGYTVSSGTTNVTTPLITPQTKEPDFPESLNGVLKRYGIQRALLLLPTLRSAKRASSIHVPFLALDILKLEQSAAIAKSFRADAIITNPTALYRFIPYLENEGFDFSDVKLISLGAELITNEKMKFFKQKFGSAKFNLTFSSSDVGRITGYQCEYLAEKGPSYYHLRDVNLTEFEPTSTDDGSVCEMIFTHLTERAFPLIRYRSGDLAVPIYEKCPCGKEMYINLKGRSNYDVMRVSGTVLYAQIISQAIESISGAFEKSFQMHVYEESVDGKLKTKLILQLVPLNDKVFNNQEQIARQIEGNLLVAADKTLADLIEDDVFLPLEIQLIEKLDSQEKSKHIISHLI